MNKVLPIANVFGIMQMLFSLAYFMPILTSIIYTDGTFLYFVEAMGINAGFGFFLWLSTHRFKRELKPRDGYILVTLAWAGMAGFATVPLLLGIPDLDFTKAYFETMSGLTTTGATALTGLDNLPPSINLWRHELNWLGGMGIIVLAVAILPLLGVGGMQLYKAETPGPMKDSKLTPRITETAKSLWMVYFGITVLCIICLKVAGMSWFDSINHAFAALGLGGFSTHDDSVGFFKSPVIEGVLIVFMMIAGMNFATHFLAWHNLSFKPYLRDIEAIMFVGLTVLSCLGIAAYIWHKGVYPEYLTALRYVSFNLVSIATDCGFANTDYGKWPIFAPLWFLFLSCVAVSSGSTGGGIKMIRTLILTKQATRELEKMIHPNICNPIKIGGAVIPSEIAVSVLGFIFLYFMSIVGATFVLMGLDLDFISSFTGVIACINNAGPGLDKVGPASNYGVLTIPQIWVFTIVMLLGRLEVFTLFVLFTPQFWRK